MRNDVVQKLVDRWEKDMAFHDIGKLAIPDHLLHKPGKLTEDEWAAIRKINWKQSDAELAQRITKSAC